MAERRSLKAFCLHLEKTLQLQLEACFTWTFARKDQQDILSHKYLCNRKPSNFNL